ncbi:MAG TPA: hypothetical protein VGM54_21535 [Chthoniobacter sp.]|jgi:hypothetical protein
MENNTISKRSIGFGLALAIASIINAIIVVVKERNDAIMNGMKKITGHHWTTHSLIVLVLFFALGGVLTLAKGGRGFDMSAGRLVGIVTSSVAAAGLIIVGFYLFGD